MLNFGWVVKYCLLKTFMCTFIYIVFHLDSVLHWNTVLLHQLFHVGYPLSCGHWCSAGTDWKLIAVMFHCTLPFRLEVQRVCRASVRVAPSSLLRAQQRPAVVLHDPLAKSSQLSSPAWEHICCKTQSVSQWNHKMLFWVYYSGLLQSYIFFFQSL